VAFYQSKKTNLSAQSGWSWHTANGDLGARSSWYFNLPTLV
jgi:hypothetical protein